MPRTIKFMDTVIRSLKPESKRQIFWSDSMPGFGIRVSPAGHKSFVFKYSYDGQSRWLTIGQYPKISLRNARRKYDELYDEVYEAGVDVVERQQKQKAKDENRTTVEQFLPSYLDREAFKQKVTFKKEIWVLETYVLPVIGKKQFHEVVTEDIEEIEKRIILAASQRKKATRGGRVAVKIYLSYVRQLFHAAKQKKLISYNPVKEFDSLGVSGYRDRVLSFQEIWLFWHGLDTSKIPFVTRQLLKFLLVTMQRGKEARYLRYDSIRAGEGVWQMQRHETKNRKRIHRVPLNRLARDILESVEPYTSASPYVFGALRAFKAPTSPKRNLKPYGDTALPHALTKNLDDLELKDVTPHDLRRTGATWIVGVGLPKLYAKLMLNHSDGERDVTSEVYVQYSYDFEKRKAAKVWEFVLDQIISCEDMSEVPTLDEMRSRVQKSGLLAS